MSDVKEKKKKIKSDTNKKEENKGKNDPTKAISDNQTNTEIKTSQKLETQEVTTETEDVPPIPEELKKFLVDLPPNIEKEKILNLPIKHIKGLSPEFATKLEKTLGLKRIKDFTNKFISQEKLTLLNVLNITEDEIDKWISVGTYIVKLIRGEVAPGEKKKILLAGLENAGKTAILNILTKRFKIADLKPTKNVEVAPLTTKTVTFNIWDMGGQEDYRKIYLSHPERFFVNVHTVIYVVDIQDKQKYRLALSYLEKILEIMESFAEFPDFLIFLHKADPQIYNDFLPEIKMLEHKFNDLFKNRNFLYRILHTSIYNAVLTDSNILDSLSNLFEFTKREDISAEVLQSIELVYNNLISFSYIIEEKFQYLESRIDNIEAQNRNLLNVFSTQQPIAPLLESHPTQTSNTVSPVNARQELNNELKRLFRKRQRSL
ncbi:MAG: ADP-ribosylation factor-like protein [Candidatus Helarchaeota archaeon]